MNTHQKVKVLFVIEGKNTPNVLAVFPDIEEKTNMNAKFVASYAHIGQHAACEVKYYKLLPQAKQHEYQTLYNELVSLGYNMEVLNSKSP